MPRLNFSSILDKFTTGALLASLIVLAGAAPFSALALTDAVNSDGESIPAGEAEAINTVTNLIHAQVQADADKTGHAFRDAHHKQHGCVRADFEVLPNLPADLSQGLFAKSAKYAAWIRYSNGSGQAQDDHAGDGRGMAV